MSSSRVEPRRRVRSGRGGRLPRTTAELRAWMRKRPEIPPELEAELVAAMEELLGWQRELLEQSKADAIKALSEGFAARFADLHRQLTEKAATVSTITRYFEQVVADLTEKSQRDAKTKLLNFTWFMERLESYLAVEQRVRWCAVGVVDIAQFKWYNDTLGHAMGDRIIEQVATILAEQIRSHDLLATERRGGPADLHARFGGDEFCFLIRDLPGHEEACEIAQRFKQAVERFDWSQLEPRLDERPVRVDVGVVCLRLGPALERRGVARKLAADLIKRADLLMYHAKEEQATRIFPTCVQVDDGQLREMPELARAQAGPCAEGRASAADRRRQSG